MSRSRTIGFCAGDGYCINCGKHFSYNAIHPECYCSKCEKLTTEERRKSPKSYCSNCGSHEVLRTEFNVVSCRSCGKDRGFRNIEKLTGFSTTITSKFWGMKMQDLRMSLKHCFNEYKETSKYWDKRLTKLLEQGVYPIKAVFLEGNKPHYAWIHKITKINTKDMSARYRNENVIKTSEVWVITCSPLRELEEEKK